MSLSDWKVGGGYIYRFHGNAECDQCSEFPVLHESDPDQRRPHPNCDCEVTRELIGGVYQEEVLKNKSVSDSDTYEIEGETVREWTNNTSTDQTHTMTITETFEVSVSLSDKTESEFAAAVGMKGTLTVSDSITKVVPPGVTIEVSVVGIVVVKQFTADQYFVFSDGREVYDGPYEDEGETLEGYRIVTNES